MTYRDDTAMLQDRLGELEIEWARRSGRVGGLAVALAEAEERAERGARALESLPMRQRVKNAGARAFGCSGSLALLAGAGSLLFLCGEAVSDVDRDLELTVVASDLPDLGAGSECTVSIEGSTGSPTYLCDAALQCRGIAIYSGRGGCDEFFAEDYVEYWDHGAARGSPRFVVVESEKRAILRQGSATVVFTTE